MTRPVSVVIPARSHRECFGWHLPPLFAEIERRAVDDEVVVIDDTGADELRSWFALEYPSVRGVVHNASRGYGKALLSGARVAKHELLFCATPETFVTEGALDSLVELMVGDDVFAVVPRVAGDGGPGALASRPSLATTPPRADEKHADEGPSLSVTPAGFLIRREDLLEHGRLDELFAPLLLEPLDLCLEAWRRGLRTVEDARSVVEYRPGDAGLDGGWTRAAFAKNRLLALWRHLDDVGLARGHLASLWRNLLDPGRAQWQNELHGLVLALEQLDDLVPRREGGDVEAAGAP